MMTGRQKEHMTGRTQVRVLGLGRVLGQSALAASDGARALPTGTGAAPLADEPDAADVSAPWTTLAELTRPRRRGIAFTCAVLGLGVPQPRHLALTRRRRVARRSAATRHAAPLTE
jgi:hypothetical protein